MVKQLTKKNCEQIGAKYVGPSKFGGVIYSYRGCNFLQQGSRGSFGFWVTISLEYDSFASETAGILFRRYCKKTSYKTYESEFDLADLKSFLDEMVNAVEYYNKEANQPLYEEDIQVVCKKVDNTLAEVTKLKEKVYTNFRWWEEIEETTSILRELKQLKCSVIDLEQRKSEFLEATTSEIQRISRENICDRLHHMQKLLNTVENIFSKHS